MLHLACRVSLNHLLGPNIRPSVTFFAYIMTLNYMDACGLCALQHFFFSVDMATFAALHCFPFFHLALEKNYVSCFFSKTSSLSG